jgi:hypothetical protein
MRFIQIFAYLVALSMRLFASTPSGALTPSKIGSRYFAPWRPTPKAAYLLAVKLMAEMDTTEKF